MTVEEVQQLSHKLHVLYAEDSSIFRKTTSSYIEPLFASLTTAVDGQDAFKKYIEYNEKEGKYYDIVITDVVMPKEDGLQLSTKLKNCNAHQPIIVTSGESDFKVLIDLFNIGVKKFVAKLFQEEEIISVIGRVAQELYKKYLEDEEQQEIQEYNEHLKERDARQSKLYNDFFEALNNNAIIAKADLEGNIIFVNDHFCNITQYTHDELIGKNFRMLKKPDTPSAFLINSGLL